MERKWGDIYVIYCYGRCVFKEQDGLHSHLYTPVSDTPTPTHYPPLLSHIGCLWSLKGHLCVNNSTLLLLYLEWLRLYIERGGGFMLCQPEVCSYLGKMGQKQAHEKSNGLCVFGSAYFVLFQSLFFCCLCVFKQLSTW